MRMLLKAVLDTGAANEVFRSGAAAEALDRIQEALQPEALYGFVEDGERVREIVHLPTDLRISVFCCVRSPCASKTNSSAVSCSPKTLPA